MITITVKRNNEHITSLEVKGHANSNEYGKDLVCAIVSGITTGLANALYEIVNIENSIVEEGHVLLQIQNPTETTDTIMNTGFIMLKTAQEVNEEYIRIMEV